MLPCDKTTKLSNCIRFLSIDAIESASSGHPGLPMGAADIATILFTEFLNFNPKDPKWPNRDRFILSAGHGSMLLYSLLYLTGYEDIAIEDIKSFRQFNSKCAGHPEYGHLAGIETTTGPLGQGLANAVGMAISEKMLESRFGSNLFNHKIYTLVGDGCLMEGISQEAISLAGHLNLDNLIVIWDDNSISIDGKTSITTSENYQKRFEACGFEYIGIDGHNYDQIRSALTKANQASKPVIIACKTIIGFGSPNKAGSEKCHGSPLGKEESDRARENLGWNYQPFEIPSDLRDEWLKAGKRSDEKYKKWNQDFSNLKQDTKSELLRILSGKVTKNLQDKIEELKQKIKSEGFGAGEATRKSSQRVLEILTEALPEMIGGSADLTESVLTKTSSTKSINSQDFSGRYLHYGVREHAMAAIMNGLSLHGNFIPYGGTFLVFSDYMKPAIRLSALMGRRIFYILTHDSIGLGEDGPTHQPIEHLAMLRSIPNLNVFRPADIEETIACFEIAISSNNTPAAFALSRQNLPLIKKDCANDIGFGGYVVCNEENPDVVLIASGSELSVAISTKEILATKQIKAKVVSLYSFEIFGQQSQDYVNKTLGNKAILKVGIEAGCAADWYQYLGGNSIFIGIDNRFGSSGKASDLFKEYGINPQMITEKIINKLSNI